MFIYRSQAHPSHRVSRFIKACDLVLVGVFVGLIIGAGLTARADAQPYGGCDEAWQAPHSEGADDCRESGWTVRKRLVLNPHGVLRYWNLETCTEGAPNPPCGWLGQEDGNGRGLSYAVTGTPDHHRYTYLWTPSPLIGHPHREWVSSEQADALAEGSASDATTRNWQQCWTNNDKAVCPDGHREEW